MLDFRNTNTLWASVLVETLVRVGLATAVISPGSRSTPLTVAFAAHPRVDAIPILDERSASFFALGHAKASRRATVLVCTSGTAGANYFPAVIEAYESQVPLLVLTADRPPELRDCASGQTIDQQKLFGRYVRSYADMSLPEATVKQLQYLRQVLAQFWQQCHHPVPGPVHLNCPFRDPLAPIPDGSARALETVIDEGFFQHLRPDLISQSGRYTPDTLLAPIAHAERGLIIAGPAQPAEPAAYCDAIATISKALGWPVLADGLSPLRNYGRRNPYSVTQYDALLRHPHHATVLTPEHVLQVGALPTSKVLRQWLDHTNPPRWIIEATGRNRDPLHGSATPLLLSLEAFVAALPNQSNAANSYANVWMEREAIACHRLQDRLESLTHIFEGSISWRLPALLPPGTPVIVANSMPVRDVEWFWPLNDQRLLLYFNRGANGIDGTLSTALGIAHYHQRAVLLTGDLALLHDSNGFLNAARGDRHLTIVLVNNQGGGIFETLPIAQFEPPFESFFATPQAVDFETLAKAHGVHYRRIETWEAFATELSKWPSTGVRLLEVRCDRKHDAQQRQHLLSTIGRFDVSG